MTPERKQKLLLYAVLLIVLIAAAAFMNRRFVQIDNCLDRGDSWDYGQNICSSDCVKSGRVFDVETATCRPDEKELD